VVLQVGCLAPGCSYDVHVACGRNAHVAAQAACAQMQDHHERLNARQPVRNCKMALDIIEQDCLLDDCCSAHKAMHILKV